MALIEIDRSKIIKIVNINNELALTPKHPIW